MPHEMIATLMFMAGGFMAICKQRADDRKAPSQ